MRKDLERIEGYRLRLRLVTPEDAAYIHGLRTNPAFNRHLSSVTGTVADQRTWIDSYRAREAAGQELYYVIEKTDGTRCGVVRLYDITADSFTWGSWILDHNKPSKAALESALLSFSVGFERLGLSKAFLNVRSGNANAVAFYQRFGMSRIGVDAINLYFEYTRDQFLQDQDAHRSVIMAEVWA